MANTVTPELYERSCGFGVAFAFLGLRSCIAVVVVAALRLSVCGSGSAGGFRDSTCCADFAADFLVRGPRIVVAFAAYEAAGFLGRTAGRRIAAGRGPVQEWRVVWSGCDPQRVGIDQDMEIPETALRSSRVMCGPPRRPARIALAGICGDLASSGLKELRMSPESIDQSTRRSPDADLRRGSGA